VKGAGFHNWIIEFSIQLISPKNSSAILIFSSNRRTDVLMVATSRLKRFATPVNVMSPCRLTSQATTALASNGFLFQTRSVRFAGNYLGEQRGIGCEHAMETNEMKRRKRDEHGFSIERPCSPWGMMSGVLKHSDYQE